MVDVLGYGGKRVVITGCATGMGASAAETLSKLGAEVHALDVSDVKAPVQRFYRTDMKEKASIEAALRELPDEVDILFNCAGVPHPPTPAFDTVVINFVGLRHLTDSMIPRLREGGAIVSISSTMGMSWKSNLQRVREFLGLETFDAAEAWLREEPELNADPYGFSKQCLIVYTQMLAGELSKRNVRINCISPSATDGAFMDKLTTVIPQDTLKPFTPANERFGAASDMGDALVLLGSDLARFISGVNLPVDFGYCAEVAMGQRDNLLNIS